MIFFLYLSHQILNKLIMSKYLNQALKKRKTHNVITPFEMNLEMEDFIPCIYNKCSPSHYGFLFGKKIIRESNGFLNSTPHTMDNGDFHFYSDEFLITFFGEIKISYMGKTKKEGEKGNYRITHIRDWQPFHFYILCFVDIDDNFTPRYYLIPKWIVIKKDFLRLTPMNGTRASNKDNKNVSKSTTIKGEDCDWFFKKHSLLKGNTFSDLKQFFNEDFIKANKTKILKSLNLQQ